MDVRPTYVPETFKLVDARPTSRMMGALDVDGQQLRLLYSRPKAEVCELMVVLADSGDSSTALAGTEGRAGTPVDLGIDRASAVYHDGIWSPGDGPDARDTGGAGRIHWDTLMCHSLTAVVGGLTCGIQALRSANVSQADLMKMAGSLPR